MTKVFIAGSRRLSPPEKPVVVYLAPKREFRNLRSAGDVTDLLDSCDREAVERFERELGITQALHRA